MHNIVRREDLQYSKKGGKVTGPGALKNPVGKSYRPAVRNYFYQMEENIKSQVGSWWRPFLVWCQEMLEDIWGRRVSVYKIRK